MLSEVEKETANQGGFPILHVIAFIALTKPNTILNVFKYYF